MMSAARVLACIIVVATGCSSPASDQRRPLVVFAASSLTEVFQALESDFEAQYPDLDLELTFAGSQVLRLQITQGAEADVFASANDQHVKALIEAGHVLSSRTFVYNELVVAVPRDNPARIDRFEQLPMASRLVIGTTHVPIGQYTRQLFDRAHRTFGDHFAKGVQASVVSNENNVRLVLAKVELGEADAAIVYATDASASRQVKAIPIPPEFNVRVAYSIGALRRAPSLDAKRFLGYVMSPAVQAKFRQHGFRSRAP